MKEKATIDLVREVLDHQLVDEKLTPCGKVDDLLLEWNGTGPPRIGAIAVGVHARMRRLPHWLHGLLQVRARAGEKQLCVPWSVVTTIAENIRLGCRAADLGLDRVEARLARLLARLPLGS